MDKESLLQELHQHTWVTIRPSPVAGIGVFALVDIPKGCRDMFSQPDPNDRWIELTKDEVASLPPHARFQVENFCLYDESVYFVPGHGFKKMDLVNFLNHSEIPNLVSINDGDYFEAIRDIRAGEELFIDYGQIVDDE